jgi:hypothetical protein
MKRVAGLALLVVCVLATGASADSGYVAHPDPAGTETLAVPGSVERYDMRNGRVTLLARGSSCRRVTWMPGAASTSARARCGASTEPATRARSGSTRVELRAGADDRPDRLLVTDAAGMRSWPLPERAFHVDVDGRTAIVSTRASREIYAVNVRTGRIALVGLTRHGETPRLNSRGLLFRDNVFKRLQDGPSTLMKFVPRRHVEAALRNVGRPLRVRGMIADLAMDGSRVALAVRRWKGGCDAVVYWNTTWNYAIPITEDDERTCAWSRQGGTIRSVSLAGLRAAWVMRVGGQDRLVSASSVDCFERRVVTADTGKGDRLVDGTGDAGLLAYLFRSPNGTVLGKLNTRMRGETIASEGGTPVSVATDGKRVAVLLSDGSVRVRSSGGDELGTIGAGDVRAIALRGRLLVALTRHDTLDVVDTRTGARVDSWKVPAGADANVDAHFGVAILTRKGEVHAVSLSSGKSVLLAKTIAPAVAAIEAPGVTYASTRGAGVIRFVPFAELERALGRAR